MRWRFVVPVAAALAALPAQRALGQLGIRRAPADTMRWSLDLGLAHAQSTSWPCLPLGDTVRLGARVTTGQSRDKWGNVTYEGYASDDLLRLLAPPFRWRVLSDDDPFWTAGGTPTRWRGAASIDEDGQLIGRREGRVAVEVEHLGRRRVAVFTVLPAITRLEVTPRQIRMRQNDAPLLAVRAEFADGRPVPATPPPALEKTLGDRSVLVPGRAFTAARSPVAPWYITLRAVDSGRERLRLRYLGRVIDVDVTVLPESTYRQVPPSATDSAMLVRSRPDTPISVDSTTARRVKVMANRCVYSGNGDP